MTVFTPIKQYSINILYTILSLLQRRLFASGALKYCGFGLCGVGSVAAHTTQPISFNNNFLVLPLHPGAEGDVLFIVLMFRNK